MSKYCIIEGRRPSGLVFRAVHGSSEGLGRYFAEIAYRKAASSVAFAELASELEAHGAPEALIEACERAGVAELRHHRSLTRLALERGARALEDEARALLDRGATSTLTPRPLIDIALENIVEGFVRQTFGATVAKFRAQNARDPKLRAIMITIARDEERHAELALDLAMWLHSKLDPVEGAWVEDAMQHAARTLVREMDSDDVDPILRSEAGLPSRAASLVIWSGLSKRVWHGLAERLFAFGSFGRIEGRTAA